MHPALLGDDCRDGLVFDLPLLNICLIALLACLSPPHSAASLTNLQAVDDNNRLPLHTAIATRAPPTLIDEILKIHPDAVLHPDVNGCLPIHLALLHKSRPEVAENLLELRKEKDGTKRGCCARCCGHSRTSSDEDEAERKLSQILMSRTTDITQWKKIETVFIHELKRAKPPILEPTPLHCALQNSDIETPVKIVRRLGWEKIVGWEGLAISANRSDVVFELGDPAKIAQVRPTMAKAGLIKIFSKALTLVWWRQRALARTTSPEAEAALDVKRNKRAKDLALTFEVQLLPIVLLAGLVGSNYFDVITDLMMVYGCVQL